MVSRKCVKNNEGMRKRTHAKSGAHGKAWIHMRKNT